MEDNPELTNPAEDPSGDSSSEGHPAGRPYSVATYNNHKCRCTLCRAALATVHREWRGRNKTHIAEYRRDLAKRSKVESHPEGKTPSHYVYSQYGCRCDECKSAQAVHARAVRERRKARDGRQR